MGVAGAAVATVLGQIISCILGGIFNITKNKNLDLNLKGFRPSLTAIKNIYKIGIPSIIMQAVGSVMNYLMNLILMGFSSTAAAVFGAYYKLQSFVFMPVFGLNNGMVPIVSYNYGARNKKRIMKTVGWSLLIAEIFMLMGLAVFNIFPKQLLEFFSASEDMIKIGIPALRTISIHFAFAGICIVFGSVFQTLGNGVYSLITSVCRQVLVLLPVAYILSKIGGLDTLWWAFAIGEVVSIIFTLFFVRRLYNRELKSMT